MHGNLEPEERIMTEPTVNEQIASIIEKLEWEPGDQISVEIGGTSVSGIDVGENYNKKWQSPIGTRKYNKDAFIVIKNLSRSPFEPSQPFAEGEFKPRHLYEEKK